MHRLLLQFSHLCPPQHGAASHAPERGARAGWCSVFSESGMLAHQGEGHVCSASGRSSVHEQFCRSLSPSSVKLFPGF